ncbi:MAG: Sulfoacetaldehyde reductase [Hyphomicrobiales bacterium]|nr:Sulfoacetaldehyde reductase [Hyphomicrobiales bacterium]
MSASLRDVVLVTGASMGIGADLARIFARDGFELALTARSAGLLEALADEIAATGRARPLVIELDLARRDAAQELAARIGRDGGRVHTLVNNAGFGLIGAAGDLDRAEQTSMIDLNVRALSDLTLAFLPSIRAARGRILNVASIAGFLPGPGMAVYYATKAYVLSFSQALAQELKDEGVTVTALCPGPTPTAFFQRAGASGDPFGPFPKLTSAQVAAAGYAGLMAGRRVVVPGRFNRLLATLSGLSPRAITLPIVARMQMARFKGAPP